MEGESGGGQREGVRRRKWRGLGEELSGTGEEKEEEEDCGGGNGVGMN